MSDCPNSSCPHRLRTGQSATYREGVTHCADCGTALVTPDRAENVRRSAPLSWRRLRRPAVTIAVVALVELGRRIPIPGVDPAYWAQMSGQAEPASRIGIGALGLVPILSAFVIIELLLALIPPWRWRRTSGPTGRVGLQLPVAVLALVLALVQGAALARWLLATGSDFRGGVQPGWSFFVTTALTLTTATFVIWWLAGVIDRFGLGNGISVLLAAQILPGLAQLPRDIWDGLQTELLTPLQILLTLGALVAVVWFAHRLVSHTSAFDRDGRPVALRSPVAGLTPLEATASLIVGLTTVGQFLDRTPPLVDRLVPGSWPYLGLGVVLVAIFTLVFGWLYHQPGRVGAAWSQLLGQPSADTTRHARGLLRPALRRDWLILSALMVAHVVLGQQLVWTMAANVLLFCVVLAVAHDLHDEWQARQSPEELIPVWTFHRVYAVDLALERLRQMEVPAHARSLHHRALLQFFGPFVPVQILVPETRAADARAFLQQRLGPPGQRTAT